MFEERIVWKAIRAWEKERRGGGISLDDLIAQVQEKYPSYYYKGGRSSVERPLRALVANGTAVWDSHLINTLHTGDDLYEKRLVFWAEVSDKFGFWKIITLVGSVATLITALLPNGVVSQLIEVWSKKP